MGLLGLITKAEYTKLQQEFEAFKRDFAPYERWQLQTAEAEKYSLPDTSIYANQADLFRKLSWVLQAVDITASAGALTPFSIKRVVRNGEPKDIPNHEFEMLLAHPNPLDSRFEFLYATIALYMLNGNAYWWLNRKDEYSPPTELWFIPPHMIKPVPDERLFIRGYMYEVNGQEIFLPPHEIVHFKRFNPFSRFVGLSAIESLALVAGGDLAMQAWNTKYFGENNARVPSILTFEQMIADPTWDKIKADTREAARKREMLMLRGTGEGVHWMQNSISQKEMEFLAGRNFNKQEIQNTLAPGLSTWLSENSTLANSESNRAAFNELTVYPKHVLMAEKITNSILTTYPGRPLVGMFDDIRISDRAMKLRELEAYERTHTIEEVRKKYYSDDPIGDERDELFVAQINAVATMPEPVDDGAGAQDAPPDVEGVPETVQKRENNKPMFDALGKYERYALRKIGEPLDFINDVIPTATIKAIADEVRGLDTDGVKAVFRRYKSVYQPVIPEQDAKAVLEGIKLAIERLKNE